MVHTHSQIEIYQQVWKILKRVEETKRHGGVSSKLLSHGQNNFDADVYEKKTLEFVSVPDKAFATPVLIL
jgi:hypothetical protein